MNDNNSQKRNFITEGIGISNILLILLTIVLAAGLVFSYRYVSIKDQEREDELRVLQEEERQRQMAKQEEALALLEEQMGNQGELGQQDSQGQGAMEGQQTADAEAKAENDEEELMKQVLALTDSFYQKLEDGLDVDILIVGDDIAAGVGASDESHGWPELLKAGLQEKYDGNVNVTKACLEGNSSFAGYATIMGLDDETEYDLVLLCYGQNDDEMYFSVYYEAMLRAVKERFERACLMAVLESGQREYTPKMQAIQNIADHYGIPVVDTIEPFADRYDELCEDEVHPNDAGQAVYCSALMETITALADERRGEDPSDVEMIKEKAAAFENFRFYGAEDFTRDGNSFTLEIKTTGVVLGIDQICAPGANGCKIFIDGALYEAPKFDLDQEASQRHIYVANKWDRGKNIEVQSEIRVVFADGEAGTAQADGFKGIVISG